MPKSELAALLKMETTDLVERLPEKLRRVVLSVHTPSFSKTELVALIYGYETVKPDIR